MNVGLDLRARALSSSHMILEFHARCCFRSLGFLVQMRNLFRDFLSISPSHRVLFDKSFLAH